MKVTGPVPPPSSPVSVFCDDGLPGPATLKLGAILTCGVLSAIRPAVRDQSAVSRTPGSPAASIVAPSDYQTEGNVVVTLGEYSIVTP